MKVLLVEESPIILGFLHEVLPRAGVEVVGETSVPQAAVNALRERKPDAMLVDLDLHDAMTVVKIANAEGHNLFIIGYAANCTECLVVEARKAGVNDLLAKPLGEPRLLEALEKCRAAQVTEPPKDESAEEPESPAKEATDEAAAAPATSEEPEPEEHPVTENTDSETPANEADAGAKAGDETAGAEG